MCLSLFRSLLSRFSAGFSPVFFHSFLLAVLSFHLCMRVLIKTTPFDKYQVILCVNNLPFLVVTLAFCSHLLCLQFSRDLFLVVTLQNNNRHNTSACLTHPQNFSHT